MYAEDDLAPISALQHFLFCPRQCALIHVEQVWEENRLTAEGRILHERVDLGGAEKRRDVKRVFALPIRSLRLGLSGKADVVEFHRDEDDRWQPYPVEYKRGRRKSADWDRVQLCAQALCLEEMVDASVSEGALFYGKEQRREAVLFDERLRQRTEDTARAVHELLAAGRTPAAAYDAKCDNCSLIDICLPRGVGERRAGRVARYVASALRDA